MRTLALILALLVVPTIVGAGENDVYMVYKENRAVLRVIDRPGPLTSTALPAAGARAARHPFLTASALAPDEEHGLRQILDASNSTAEFLAKLRTAGYRVRRE
ncbi:MAG: hypothetical protein QGI13_17410 [Rhodospirillales bacterium]|nr:hypothetical protein [Rhodospirillales bacterium]